MLRLALDVAVRDGLLGANPAAKVKQPGIARQGSRGTSRPPMWCACSMRRRGCATAWRWCSWRRRGYAVVRSPACCGRTSTWPRVSWWCDTPSPRVGGELVLTEPKTARSRRRVPLHAGVVTQLRAHRKQQLQERLHAGDQWTDTGAVFATEFGTMLDPRNLAPHGGDRGCQSKYRRRRRSLAAAQRGRGVAGERGAYQGSGRSARATASIAITGDLYGHTSDNTARAAVDGLGTALGL